MPLQLVRLLNPIQMYITGTFTPKGAYNVATDYTVGDMVSYDGSSYIMYSDAVAGTIPTDTTKWGVVSNKGNTGPTGPTGTAGTTDHLLLSNIGTNTHAAIDTHIASTANPHSVTKAQVGLGSVDNTTDLEKPISTATQTALDAHKADTTAVHGIADTSALYRAGETDVAVADGGTGSSTTSGALTNLGAVAKSGDTMTGVLTLSNDPTQALHSASKRYVDQHTTITVSRSAGADFVTSNYASDDLAIQAAIDSLPTTGGEVKVRAGFYAFANPVLIRNNYTKIMGDGLATYFQWKSGGTYTGQWLIQTKPYTTINNIRFHGNRNVVTGGSGLYVYESSRVQISDCYFYDFNQNAINAFGTSSATSSHANKFTNIYIINCGGYGYQGQAFTYDSQFVGMWVATCNVGIRVENSENFFTNLHIWGCASHGIEIRNAQTRIVNGYLETNGGNGADIFNTNTASFTNVHFWKNGLSGVNVSSANNVRFHGCEFSNNGQTTGSPGINVSGTSVGTTVIGSEMFDDQTTKTQTYGIVTTSTTSETMFMGNTSKSSRHLTGPANFAGSNETILANVGINPENLFEYGSQNGSGTVFLDHRNGHILTATLTGNWSTVSFITTHAIRGEQVTLVLAQDTTGGRTITWPSTVKLAGGALALSTTANAIDVIRFVWDGSFWRETSRAIQDVVSGDVTGPASSTDNAIARFDGTTGKLIKVSATATSVAEGGTGATTAAAARTNLSLAIGTDVQAYNANTTLLGNTTTGTGSIVLATSPTLSGLNLGTSELNTVGNITADGQAARTIGMTRTTTGAGSALILQAAQAQVGGTNLSGGELRLFAGVSTGSSRSTVVIGVSAQGTSGTGDNAISQLVNIFQASSSVIGGYVNLGAGGSTTNAQGGGNSFNVSGGGTGSFAMYRHSTANTAGNSLNVISGGATSAATDKAAGNLILRTGISTGTGSGSVLIQTPTPGTTGTTDNAVATRMTLSNTGVVIPLGSLYSLQLSDTTGVAAGGITFGTDVQLYRSAANTLKTDDSFVANNIATALSTKTAAYTITATDAVILADATTAAFTVTLPTAVGITGRTYTVKKIDAGLNTVTVAPTGMETIDGVVIQSLVAQNASQTYVSSGASWFII